jgi:hypothetical protein
LKFIIFSWLHLLLQGFSLTDWLHLHDSLPWERERDVLRFSSILSFLCVWWCVLSHRIKWSVPNFLLLPPNGDAASVTECLFLFVVIQRERESTPHWCFSTYTDLTLSSSWDIVISHSLSPHHLKTLSFMLTKVLERWMSVCLGMCDKMTLSNFHLSRREKWEKDCQQETVWQTQQMKMSDRECLESLLSSFVTLLPK